MNPFFFNKCFEKSNLKALISWSLLSFGERKTLNLVEKLKDLGFMYATQAGVSLSLDDLKTPPTKIWLISEAEYQVGATKKEYYHGNLTAVEKLQQLIDTWNRTSELLKDDVIQNFKATDILNPVYMMAFSGARGNISQVRQLVGMRGLMADPQGQIIDFPIRSNFREGLTLTEYVISCYGARKGLVDTALKTANSGYLTRRLVDVSQHVIIGWMNCGTRRGILLGNMMVDNKIILPLQTRLVGRVLAKDINPIAVKNQQISIELALKIAQFKETILVRSPLTCKHKKFLCQFCYGWSLAYGNLVAMGEAVGVLAAQSIGEPGTQLTMRTFHTGGVFSGGVVDEIRAPFNGFAFFNNSLPGKLIRTSYGKIAFFSKKPGEVIFCSSSFIKPESTFALGSASQKQGLSRARHQIPNNSTEKIKFFLPKFTILFIRNAGKIYKGQLVAEFSSLTDQKREQIRAEHLVRSETTGQVFFQKNTQFFSKKPKISHIDSLWILSAKIYKSSVFSPLFLKKGDFFDSKTTLNQSLGLTTNTGFISSYLLPKKKTVPLFAKNNKLKGWETKQITLKQPIQNLFLKIPHYKRFSYFFSLPPSLLLSGASQQKNFLLLASGAKQEVREAKAEGRNLMSLVPLTTAISKKEKKTIGVNKLSDLLVTPSSLKEHIEHFSKNDELAWVKKSVLYHWFPQAFQTKTAGIMFLSSFITDTVNFDKVLFWLSEESYQFHTGLKKKEARLRTKNKKGVLSSQGTGWNPQASPLFYITNRQLQKKPAYAKKSGFFQAANLEINSKRKKLGKEFYNYFERDFFAFPLLGKSNSTNSHSSKNLSRRLAFFSQKNKKEIKVGFFENPLFLANFNKKNQVVNRLKLTVDFGQLRQPKSKDEEHVQLTSLICSRAINLKKNYSGNICEFFPFRQYFSPQMIQKKNFREGDQLSLTNLTRVRSWNQQSETQTSEFQIVKKVNVKSGWVYFPQNEATLLRKKIKTENILTLSSPKFFALRSKFRDQVFLKEKPFNKTVVRDYANQASRGRRVFLGRKLGVLGAATPSAQNTLPLGLGNNSGIDDLVFDQQLIFPTYLRLFWPGSKQTRHQPFVSSKKQKTKALLDGFKNKNIVQRLKSLNSLNFQEVGARETYKGTDTSKNTEVGFTKNGPSNFQDLKLRLGLSFFFLSTGLSQKKHAINFLSSAFGQKSKKINKVLISCRENQEFQFCLRVSKTKNKVKQNHEGSRIKTDNLFFPKNPWLKRNLQLIINKKDSSWQREPITNKFQIFSIASYPENTITEAKKTVRKKNIRARKKQTEKAIPTSLQSQAKASSNIFLFGESPLSLRGLARQQYGNQLIFHFPKPPLLVLFRKIKSYTFLDTHQYKKKVYSINKKEVFFESILSSNFTRQRKTKLFSSEASHDLQVKRITPFILPKTESKFRDKIALQRLTISGSTIINISLTAISTQIKITPLTRKGFFDKTFFLSTYSFTAFCLGNISSKKTYSNEVKVTKETWIATNRPTLLTDYFSPYHGEIARSHSNSSCIILTDADQITLSGSLIKSKKTKVRSSFSNTGEKKKKLSVQKPTTFLGQFVRAGEEIIMNHGLLQSGQIIQIEKEKLALRIAYPLLLSFGSIFHVQHTSFVEKNDQLFTLFYQIVKTGDIVQGIPKIEQLFEARGPLSEGRGTEEKHLFASGLSARFWRIYRNYSRKFSNKLAVRRSFKDIQKIIVQEVYMVYQEQGVNLAEKHLEIIVRQMTSFVLVVNAGDSYFLPGEIVPISLIEKANNYLIFLEAANSRSYRYDKARRAQYIPVLFGITKAALRAEGFISAASFQETTRVLSQAAVEKKKRLFAWIKRECGSWKSDSSWYWFSNVALEKASFVCCEAKSHP